MSRTRLILAAVAAALATSAHAAGDPAAGQQKNFQCMGCHGIPGWKTAFPEVYQRAEAGRAARRLPGRPRSSSTRRASATTPRCAPSPRACPRRTWRTSRPTTRRPVPRPRPESEARHEKAPAPRARRPRPFRPGLRGLGQCRGRQGQGGALQGLPRRSRHRARARNSPRSAASTPTTSPWRCATTSSASARTRSWRARCEPVREGHARPRGVVLLAVRALDQVLTARGSRHHQGKPGLGRAFPFAGRSEK